MTPTRESYIYLILFDDYFKKSKLREFIIKQLIKIWKIWEEKSFLLIPTIFKWKNFSNHQRHIVGKIWYCVGQETGNVYDINILLTKQEHEMNNKTQIKEKISKYLEIYCQNACDKQTYFDCLVDMDTQLKSGIVGSITIPKEIESFLRVANCLNTLEKLYTWKSFLAKNQRCK
jgi:hypothetical protein